MDSTANRIKQALHLRNMRQADLVNLTGIGKSSISTYISGEYEPKQKNIYKIAKALDVSEAWLMGLDIPMERKEPAIRINDELIAKIKNNPKLQELIDILSDASEEGLDTLINVAKMIDKGKSKD